MQRRQVDQATAGTSGAAPARPALVGRRADLDRLTAALEAAAHGRGHVLFLSGDPGIGKTRLAHEALALARTRGWRALEGRAYPLETGLAYAPILAAFGPFLRNLDPARQARFVNGLPDLGRLFADLRLPAPTPLADPALEKTRLFDAVARLVERLTRDTPVVLFLDDLHWADPASIELLHYLGRGLATQPVLVLGTYRADEVNSTRGLRALLTSLRRAGLGEELALSRLDQAEVAELAGSVLGSAAPAELLALLEARAGGTPLFIEALLQALMDTGQLAPSGGGWTLGPDAGRTLPAGVRELILERLERLSPADRGVMDVIAVHGEAIPSAILQTATRLHEEALLEALDRLRASGLIAEELDGPEVRYDLTHPLIREVAYAELSEMARRRAHAAIAGTLERLRPDDLERLAFHYRGAGPAIDQVRALEVFLAAGEQARDVYANEEAAHHFQAALDLVRQGRRSELLPPLLEKLGEAWERVGERAAAVAIWREALAAYQAREEIAAVARLRHQLALAEWERGRFEAAEAHVAAGIEALAGHPASRELADLHHVRAIFLIRLADKQRLAPAAAELHALAARLNSARVLTQTYLVETLLLVQRAEYASAWDAAQKLVGLAEAEGELLLAHQAHFLLSNATMSLGEHRLARYHCERDMEVVQRLGAPPLEWGPRCWGVIAGYISGDWDRALREAGEFLALTQRLELHRNASQPHALRAMILARRGELDEAASSLHEARSALSRFPADRHVSIFTDLAEAVLAVEQGRFDVARSSAIGMDASSWDSLRPLGLAVLAEVHVRAGEPEEACRIARTIAVHGTSEHPYPAALADQIEGLAFTQRVPAPGETERALVCLRRAAEAFKALEIPFEFARCQLAWARLVAGTDPTTVEVARESAEIFERLGARSYLDQARALLRALGIRPVANRRSRAGPAELSARELAVVRLAVAGLTTADIAERLVVSPHTVTTHLKRVYERFGIHSRAALVRYAEQAAWLEAGDRYS